jgi:hypothetical protein
VGGREGAGTTTQEHSKRRKAETQCLGCPPGARSVFKIGVSASYLGSYLGTLSTGKEQIQDFRPHLSDFNFPMLPKERK